MSEGEYSLTTARYGDRVYLDLERTAAAGADEPQRTIQVTLPVSYDFFRLYAGTRSGNILFQNCNSTKIYSNTESGDMEFENCKANQTFTAETHSGNVTITGLSCGGAGYSFEAYVKAESGKVQFQTTDSLDNYHYIFDTRSSNTITVNGQNYNGSNFELNRSAPKAVSFESGYIFDGDDRSGLTGQGTATFIITDAIQ